MRKLSMMVLLSVILVASLGCRQVVEDETVIEATASLETEESVAEEPEIAVTLNAFPVFELQNLNEETVTDEIFSEHELTLVNIWATTCPPCIREMPELEQLQNNYKDKGLKVVGLIADGNYLAGKKIVEGLLLTYEQIIPDKEFLQDYLSQFQFVPTTLFVNTKGEILGDPMVGAYDYETFEEVVKKHLGIE